MEAVLQFLFGANTIMCLLVGLFFLRFWRRQRDPFHAWFMAAFWAFAMSWGTHLVFASGMSHGRIRRGFTGRLEGRKASLWIRAPEPPMALQAWRGEARSMARIQGRSPSSLRAFL